MLIKNDPAEREQQYRELLQQCSVSRSDRRASYDMLRSYYLYGCPPEGTRSAYNKIFPHIDLLTSFTFASETTRFSVALDQGVQQSELDKSQALALRVTDKWFESNADIEFGKALTEAFVYSTSLIKLVQRGRETMPYMVDPGSFGVLREDCPTLADQEAFVHFYYITRTQLEADLKQCEHPRINDILNNVSTNGGRDDNSTPSGLQRVMLSASSPTMMGNLENALPYFIPYQARIAVDLIDMAELWIYDSKEDDYRVVTLAGTNGEVVVFDRTNFFLPRDGEDDPEQPFIQVCPNPAYDYFWGMSEVERLTGLQDLRNQRVSDIMDLLGKAVDPPWALTGWDGLVDEKSFALRKRGSAIGNPNPTAKVDSFAPTVPNDVWADVREIDAMFAEASGLGSVLQGRGESGVRSRGHASELARLGSARVKKRALIVEDSLERMATLYLRCAQRYDPTPLLYETDKQFIAHQFTKSYHVKVDAHSSSPLFAEDLRKLAFELREVGAISNDSLLDMVQPPMLQSLKKKLKEQEAAQAKASAEEKEEERSARMENQIRKVG